MAKRANDSDLREPDQSALRPRSGRRSATRSPSGSADTGRFDASYYHRHYERPTTRAESPEETQRRGRFISAYAHYLDLPVQRILDIGCGVGRLIDTLQEEFPDAQVHGVEYSQYACAEFGWQQGSVVDFEAPERYDIVVCNDVIQYLSNPDAARAIDNLATLCRGALYLGALTKEDWLEHCDQSRTDGDVYLRTTRWYRRKLGNHFANIGGGLHVRYDTPVLLWSMEYLS